MIYFSPKWFGLPTKLIQVHFLLQHSTAGWIVFIAICTIGFAIVIALYGPVVFGQKALAKGMECATEFLEFFLPLKYEGKPVDEKVPLTFIDLSTA